MAAMGARRDGIRFSRLTEVPVEQVMGLLNDPEIVRHMPLAELFDEAAAQRWIEGKDAQWAQNGYGPWAVHVGDSFAGWCGFQLEGADPDFAMVLRPAFWGVGRYVYMKALDAGFDELGYSSIVITLPPTRKVSRVLRVLGFRDDGEVEYWGSRFNRFRIDRERWQRFTRERSDLRDYSAAT